MRTDEAMEAIESLVKLLSRLPGIGGKSASRIAYHLIAADEDYDRRLGQAISEIKGRIHFCPCCGAYAEDDLCEFCSDSRRDQSLLCVVEQPQDVITIASSGIYGGLFHVLGGAIDPMNGIGPDQLSFPQLKRRVQEGSFKEVIIATNPTEEGDTTALYIRQILKGQDITVSRLAAGLPIGGDLEYADRLTLARSIRGRISY